MKWIYSLLIGILKIIRDKKTKSKFLHIVFWIKIKFLSVIQAKKSGSVKFLNFTVNFITIESLAYLFEEIFIFHIYHFETNKDKPVIIDAGSNIGMATLYFKFYRPNSNVMCFEADPTTFLYLKKNIEENKLENVQVHNVALWSEETSLNFKKSSNLISHVQQGKSEQADLSKIQQESTEHYFAVQANILSPYIKGPIDFLKIDIEGAESNVFAELETSDKLKFIDQMTIECHLQNGLVTNLKNLLRIISDEHYFIQVGTYQLLNRNFLVNQDCMIYVKKKS